MTSRTRSRAHAIKADTGGFTATCTCQYMENHRPVQPLGPQDALGTAMSSQGEPWLFTLDATGNLVINASVTGAASPGWSSNPIAAEVIQHYTNQGFAAAATRFAVSQSADTGEISVLLGVNVVVPKTATTDPLTYDEVWQLPNLQNTPDAAWMTSATARTWTAITYDGAVEGVSLTTLSLQDLRVLKTFNAGTPMQTLVHVMAGNGALQPFYVATDGSTPAWTPLGTATDSPALLDAAVGSPDFMRATGLYRIYPTSNDGVVLTWMSGQDNLVQYQVQNPTALAVLPVVDPDQEINTELFVSDGGSIVYFSEDADSTTPPTVLVTPSWLSPSNGQAGCAKLYVGTDGSVVSLWGLTFSGIVFHMQAPFLQRMNPIYWSTPVPLMANVTAADMHISATRGLTSMFAVQNNPVGPAVLTPPNRPNAARLGAVNTYTASGPQLFELHKDHLSSGGYNHWRKRFVHLPDENNYQTLQTYTHRVQFQNQYAQPASQVEVLVTSTASIVLEINNRNVTVSSQTGAKVKTDAAGMLEVLMLADSPAQPTLTFTMVGQTGATVTIDPTGPVRAAALSGISSPTAAPANSNGQLSQQSWYNSTSLGNAQTAAANIPASPPGVRLSREHAKQLGWSLDPFAGIGDVLQALYDDVSDFVSAVINLAGDVATLVVTFTDFVFEVLITTVEDIAGAIVAVLAWIGAAIEDVFKWLAFLFDWGNIKAITGNLVTFYTSILSSMKTVMPALFGQVATELTTYAGQIAGFDVTTIPQQGTNDLTQNGAAAQTANAPSNAPASNDPRLSWGQSQLPAPSGSSATTSYWHKKTQAGWQFPIAASPKADGDAMSDIVTDIENFLAQIGSAVTAYYNGSLTLQGFGQAVQQDAEKELAALLNSVAAGLTAQQPNIQSTITTCATTLTNQIQIPLFSSLFLDATGEPLSLLSLVSLLQAVPTTLVYGIVNNGGGNAADFLSSAQTGPVLATFNGLVSNPSAATQARRPRLGADDQGNSTASNMRMALGVLHGARIVTSLWLLAAEKSGAVTLPASLDTALWVAEAVLDILVCCSETGSSDGVTVCNTVAAGFAAINCLGGLPPKKLVTALGGWSFMLSFKELWHGIPPDGDDSVETLDNWTWIAYGLNEFLELFQYQFAEETPPNTTGIEVVAGLRVGGMAAACVTEILASVAEAPA